MNISDKTVILNEIKRYYKFKSNVVFADFLGIKANTLSNWYSRNSIDYELIITKCVDINGDWLLTGKGNMLISNKEVITEESERIEELKYTIKLLREKTDLLQKENTLLKKETQPTSGYLLVSEPEELEKHTKKDN